MAKKIVILEKENNPNEVIFRYVFWLDVLAARQFFYADAGKNSSYRNVSATELDAIRNGSVQEVLGEAVFSKTDTISVIKNFLINKYNAEQTKLNNVNEWGYYGSYWDGAAWTNQGVA